MGELAPGHWRSHVEPSHDTEHEFVVQRTWHVAPWVHDTEPLSPTVMTHVDALHVTLPLSAAVSVQLDWSLHSALHDDPQAPTQVVPEPHERLQLLVLASHVPPVQPQLAAPPGQVEDDEPHAAAAAARLKTASNREAFIGRLLQAWGSR